MPPVIDETEVTDEVPESSLLSVVAAIQRAGKGEISYADLLKLVAPEPAAVAVRPEVPKPAVITDKQREALTRVRDVFGVVDPSTRRVLTVEEVGQLVDEREVLDEIDKMVTKRKADGIRQAVANHLDLVIDQEAAQAAQEGRGYELPSRDGKGHYVRAGEAVAPEKPKKFTREVRSGGVNLDPEMLRLLADDPRMVEEVARLLGPEQQYSHQDYLAMTRPVRMLDEAAVMSHLRKNPHLVHVLKLATVANSETAAICMREP